jgi:hypothetical protein
MEIISTFLTVDDSLSLANTCFVINVAVYPPQNWPSLIQTLLADSDMDDDEDSDGEQEGQAQVPQGNEVSRKAFLIKLVSTLGTPNLFGGYNNPNNGRLASLLLYGRGSHLLCLEHPQETKLAIMVRYLLPKLRSGSLYVKLTCTIRHPERGQLSSGDPLYLTSAFVERLQAGLYIAMRFDTASGAIPALISQGGTRVVLHALYNDGRTISPVTQWSCSEGPQNAFIPLRDSQGNPRGKVNITLVGQRATKFLGKLLHDDEHIFAREITSSAAGGHGQGSWDVRKVQEHVDYQTPRIAYKPPAGYYEISRNGIEVLVPIETLFNHCL